MLVEQQQKKMVVVEEKMKKFKTICEEQNIVFYPLVVVVFGSFHESASLLLDKIAKLAYGAFICFYAKSLVNTYTDQRKTMQAFRDEIFNDIFRDGFQKLLNAETLR